MIIRHFTFTYPTSEEGKKRFDAEVDEFIQKQEKEGLIVIKETQFLVTHSNCRSDVLITIWMDNPYSSTVRFLKSIGSERDLK